MARCVRRRPLGLQLLQLSSLYLGCALSLGRCLSASACIHPPSICLSQLLTNPSRSSPSLIRRYGSSTQAAEVYASKAIGLINSNLDHPNLADIQALCLVIIHEWGSRNAVRAYIYLGQAARMLQMYRILNGHHPTAEGDLFLRDESFRRTLWLIYILDCLLTSTPGRFPALTPQDTSDVALPCSDIHFAFGNAVHVKSLLQHFGRLSPSSAHLSSTHLPAGEIGEYGYIVIAATLWRDAVGMLTTSGLHTYDEEDCSHLIAKIDDLRASLPMQFVDKPGQINLHMTMGSGYTFAMLHCLLHCATIFVHRRRLLQDVYAHSFSVDAYRVSGRGHDILDRLFTSCHSTLSLLAAVEAGSEKEQLPSFPIFMLFSAFTASATVAYLSLKGLTPNNAAETAAQIVRDGLRFMHEGAENWPLMTSWLRHLSVMQRVLNNDAASASGRQGSNAHSHSGVKDEVSSNADTNPEAMDYDQTNGQSHSAARSVDNSRDGSEPPATVTIPRRPGVTTINGHSSGADTPNHAASPPGSAPPGTGDVKRQTPETSAPTNGDSAHAQGESGPTQDMTAPELCAAFERQLLDLDDLAAFMGGGV